MGTLQTTAFATASGTPPHPRRHPDESQDPEPSSAAFVILGPDFRQDDGVARVKPHPTSARHSRGGGNPYWLASHYDHRPPRIWIPACAGMTMRCVTRGICVMATKAVMPMAAHDENSLPFRGGSGWGMSTRARSTWHCPSHLKRAGIPIRQQELFPREGGDPDWAPAFAGEQGSGSRPAQDPAPLSDPTTTPYAPKDGEIAQTPRPPLADTLIRCPTHASERTLSGCPTPPLSRMHHPRPKTPLSNPISGDVQNAVRL